MRCLKVPHFLLPSDDCSSTELTAAPEQAGFLELWHDFIDGPHALARQRWDRSAIDKILTHQEIAQISYDDQDHPIEITSPIMGTIEMLGKAQFYRPDLQPREVAMSTAIENYCQLRIPARIASALFKTISHNFIDKMRSSEVILFINITQAEFLRREMSYCHSYRQRNRHSTLDFSQHSSIPLWVNWVTTQSELVTYTWTILTIRALNLPTLTTQFSINVSALHAELNECAVLPYLVYQAWKMMGSRQDQSIKLEIPILHSEVVRLERAAAKRQGGRK